MKDEEDTELAGRRIKPTSTKLLRKMILKRFTVTHNESYGGPELISAGPGLHSSF
jgi:hypothetical protein